MEPKGTLQEAGGLLEATSALRGAWGRSTGSMDVANLRAPVPTAASVPCGPHTAARLPPPLPRDPVSASTTSLRAPWLNTCPESRPGSWPLSTLRLDLSLPPALSRPLPFVPSHSRTGTQPLPPPMVVSPDPSLLCQGCRGGLPPPSGLDFSPLDKASLPSRWPSSPDTHPQHAPAGSARRAKQNRAHHYARMCSLRLHSPEENIFFNNAVLGEWIVG